jgi:hypothetical protein
MNVSFYLRWGIEGGSLLSWRGLALNSRWPIRSFRDALGNMSSALHFFHCDDTLVSIVLVVDHLLASPVAHQYCCIVSAILYPLYMLAILIWKFFIWCQRTSSSPFRWSSCLPFCKFICGAPCLEKGQSRFSRWITAPWLWLVVLGAWLDDALAYDVGITGVFVAWSRLYRFFVVICGLANRATTVVA